MTVAPTRIPRTGTSGYRNGKLGTHHQQDLASCRSLPITSAGRRFQYVPLRREHRQVLAPTADPSKKTRCFSLTTRGELNRTSRLRICLFFLLFRPRIAPGFGLSMGDQCGQSDGIAVSLQIAEDPAAAGWANRIQSPPERFVSFWNAISAAVCNTRALQIYLPIKARRPPYTMSERTTHSCCVEVTRATGACSAATDGFTSAGSSKSRLNLASRGLEDTL